MWLVELANHERITANSIKRIFDNPTVAFATKIFGPGIVGLSNNFSMDWYWSGFQNKCRM